MKRVITLPEALCVLVLTGFVLVLATWQLLDLITFLVHI